MSQPFTFTSHTSVDPPLPHQVFHILPAAFWRPQRCGFSSEAAKRRGNFNLCRRLDFIPKFWMPLHFDAPFRPLSCFGILARDAISRHHTSPWPVSWYHHEKSSPPATTLCFTISLRQRWWTKLETASTQWWLRNSWVFLIAGGGGSVVGHCCQLPPPGRACTLTL